MTLKHPKVELSLTVGMFVPDGRVDAAGYQDASCMVKTALLYADKVHLVGHGGALSACIALGLATGPLTIAPGRERQAEDVIGAITSTDVYRAIQRGLVSTSWGWALENEAEYFISNVLKAVDDDNAYPLLDYATVRYLDNELSETPAGLLTALDRGKHAFLAQKLMERLPTFDAVPLDELLDIKRELAPYLIRFRSGLMRFGRDIGVGPWSADFPAEAEDWLIREVEPAVQEIEEAVRSNKMHAGVLRTVTNRPLILPSTSFLSLLLAQASAMPRLLQGAMGLGAGAALTAYDAYKAWEEKTRETERNALFFYYKASKRIQPATRPGLLSLRQFRSASRLRSEEN